MTRRRVRLSRCLALAAALATSSALGSAGPALAAAAWSAPRDVFTTEVSSILPDGAHRKLALEVRADSAGNAVAAWLQKLGTSCQARWATRPVGGAWSTPKTLAGPAGTCPLVSGGISLAMNTAGTAVAAWLDGADVWAAVRPSGGSFGTAVKLSTGLTNSPTASINDHGKAAVGWVLQGVGFNDPSPFQAKIRPAGGSFGTLETVNVAAGSGVFAPRIAVGPGGDVLAAWARTVSNLSNTDDMVETAYRPASGRFPAAPTQTLDGPYLHRTGSPTDLAPDLAFDATGRATVVWVHDTGSTLQVQSASKVAGADTFGGALTVNPGDAGASRAARLAVDRTTNTAVAAWLQCAASCVVQSAARPSGGIYGTVKTLSGALPTGASTVTPTVGFTSTGTAVAAWSGPVAGIGPDAVQVVRRPKGGTFGVTKVISGPVGADQDRGPSLAFDGAGSALAVWAHVTVTPSAVLRYADFLASYYRPDALIKKAAAASYTGAKIYNTSGLHQSVTAKVRRGHAVTFDINVVNRSSTVDSFRVKGPAAKSGFTVRYLSGTSGTTAVTTAVVDGHYTLAHVGPGGSRTFRLVVTVKQGTAVGASANWLIYTTSRHDATRKDTVNAVVKVVS